MLHGSEIESSKALAMTSVAFSVGFACPRSKRLRYVVWYPALWGNCCKGNKLFLACIKHSSTLLIVVGLTACAANIPTPLHTNSSESEGEKSQLSYGMVKKLLVVGQTSQSDVIKAFGAPNNMTYAANGGEMWVYDQVKTDTVSSVTSARQGVTVGAVGGAGSSVGVAGGSSMNRSSTVQSSSVRTLTVILEFDRQGRLLTHSARVGGY